MNRTDKRGVDTLIFWLTGYDKKFLQKLIDAHSDLKCFFAEAPQLNHNVSNINVVVCGIFGEEIEDPLMQKIYFLDKLIDKLIKGKVMEKILRQ